MPTELITQSLWSNKAISRTKVQIIIQSHNNMIEDSDIAREMWVAICRLHGIILDSDTECTHTDAHDDKSQYLAEE